MRRVILLLFSLVAIAAPSAFAQQFSVKGKVISEEGNEPLIGVAIIQEGSGNGVITDMDGNYIIEIRDAAQATLTFKYVGMKDQQHVVTAQTKTLDITMASDAQVMDEVVVVAYGVRKKGTITGSVSTVKSDKLESVPAAGFDQALQGQTPGLTVVSNSGEPSKAASFKIRGTNSINSGTDPLFILDGVPISSSDFNTLSPSDIESISILKDASSTSIYGARASNGVVVITTKRGTALDKAQVILRTQWGFSRLANDDWKMMDTPERIAFEKEIGLDTNQDYDILSRTNVNWLEEVFNDKAMLQSYDLSVSRATDKLNYFVSGSFFDQDGIAQSSKFRRYNMRANADVKASDWLKIGTNSMIAYEEIQQADDGVYSLVTPISASRFMLPYWAPYKKDGSIASSSDGSWTGTGLNPIEWMENNPIDYKKYKAMTVLYAEIYPIEGMTFRTQFSADYSHSTGFMQSFSSYPGNGGIGAAGRNSSDALRLNILNQLNYRFTVNKRHSFNLMLAQEGSDYRSEGFSITTKGQNNDFFTNVSSGTRASSWSDSTTSYALLSVFGRAEYNFDDKYYVELSARGDASSRFGKDNRWGHFGSIGLMWNAKKEKFLKKHEWLTNAQVAFSTGTSGNSEIPNYDHLALVAGGYKYMDQGGIAPIQSGNEDLSWESTWANNLGFHLGFWNRVNVDLELYHKKTTNMLMAVPRSYADNAEGSRWDNIGAMINRGAEISVNTDVIRSNNFVWNVNANVSYNYNEITELYNGLDEYEMSTTAMKLVVGKPYGEFYLVRYAGVNPANGDALWYTKDGEITNKYSEDDKVMLGKGYNAPWQGGFGTSLSWKGITLSAQFSWIGKRYMFNNDRFFEESNGLYSVYNQSKRMLYDRWKQPGDVTDIPRYGITPQMDSRFIENASFMRLKNLMVSYSLPQAWLKKTRFFNNVRLYAQGQNLLTWTGFSGLDPESSSNMYKAQYPMARQFSFGVDMAF